MNKVKLKNHTANRLYFLPMELLAILVQKEFQLKMIFPLKLSLTIMQL